MVITAHPRPLHSVENVHCAIETVKGFASAVTFLDELIDQFADTIAPWPRS